jgi:hypothetical protein
MSELDLLRRVERESRALREPVGYESGASSHGLDEALKALDEWRAGDLPCIYMASKAKHGARWRALRDQGWPIISTWINESEVGQTVDWTDLWVRSIRESSAARVLIAYHERGEVMKGALVEMGAALSRDRHVLWVGLDKEYTSWNHPNVIPCSSLEDALERCERVFGIRRVGG